METVLNPFTDWGFKRLFGQENSKIILKDFLNALLAGEHVITDLTYLNKERQGGRRELRGCVYDVCCETDKGERIIVEMQNHYQKYFFDRTLYYAAQSIVSQAQAGSWDYSVAPVYVVSFMNFLPYNKALRKLRTDVMLTDISTKKVFSDHLRLIYITLPLFTKKAQECVNDFDKRMYILKNMEKMEEMRYGVPADVYDRLSEIANVSELPPQERSEYEESLKVMRDNYAVEQTWLWRLKDLEERMEQGIQKSMEKGLKKGIKQGIQKGRAEGEAKGRAEGKAEGEAKGKVKIARKMLAMGLDADLITQITGLSAEELDALRNE